MKVKEITHVKTAMPWPYIVLMGVMKNSLKRFAKFLFNDNPTDKSRYYFLLAWEMGVVDMYIHASFVSSQAYCRLKQSKTRVSRKQTLINSLFRKFAKQSELSCLSRWVAEDGRHDISCWRRSGDQSPVLCWFPSLISVRKRH